MGNRRGFTLIELLAVMVILGVLASIGIPKMTQFKQRALNTAMISDLRHLAEAQEAYLFTHGDYAGSIGPGPEVPGTGGAGTVVLVPSDGVRITMSYRTTPGLGEGWSAVAHHDGMTDPNSDDCGIFLGHPSYAPNVAVTEPGVVGCW
jgi:prepilin-type N-terminal cleavage/methylation domain-containing protein